MAVPRTLASRRGHRRPLLRVVVLVGTAVVAVALVWALAIGMLWGYTWVRLGGIDLRALDDDVEPLGHEGAVAPVGTTTVLVSVTALRDPTRPVEPDLMASVALVQVGGPRDEPAVLLLPMDLPVTVDGHGTLELAEVQLEGGSDLLTRSIVDYTGVRVDHVVSVSIETLPRLVDIVGEIELCMPDGCRPAAGSHISAGQLDDDPVHAARVFAGALRGVAEAFDGMSMWTSPLQAKRAVDVVAEQVETDVSLRGTTLVGLAEVLAQPTSPTIDAVPVLRHPRTDRIVPLEEPAELRFQHLREGTPLQPRDPSDELHALVMRDVAIAVLNGAGIEGLAGSVAARLNDQGVPTVGVGNAPTSSRDRSVVTYRAGDDRVETAAIIIAGMLGDVELEAADRSPTFEGDDVDITIVAAADLAETEDDET